MVKERNYTEYTTEKYIEERKKSNNKNFLYLGSVGSGKTTAIKSEIENILEKTDDHIIVIDKDRDYVEYRDRYKNRINIYDASYIGKGNYEMDVDYLNNILKIVDQKAEEKNVWFYVDNLKINDKFIYELLKIRGNTKNLIISISSNNIMEYIGNDIIKEYYSEYGSIRLFKTLKNEADQIYRKYNIDIEELELDRSISIVIKNRLNADKNMVINNGRPL